MLLTRMSQGSSHCFLVEQYGGIDGQRNLLNKKILFLQDDNVNTDNDNWTFQQTMMLLLGID